MAGSLAGHQTRYHTRKAQGLCPHCGKRRPYPGIRRGLRDRAIHEIRNQGNPFNTHQ